MRLEAYRRLGEKPIVCDVTSVILKDDNGNVISAACVDGPYIHISNYGQPGFDNFVAQLGINKLRVAKAQPIDGLILPPSALPSLL